MSAQDFIFPKFYSLPPFFTRQPVERTFHKQLHLWKKLILSYSQAYKLYTLSIKDKIFYNEAINRGLDSDFIREVFHELVMEGKAEWTQKGSSLRQSDRGHVVGDEIRLYWNNKEEWATIIWNWVLSSGREGSVCTLYELREGEAAEGCAFQGMDLQMLKDVLSVLESRGKCARLGEEGVKFGRE